MGLWHEQVDEWIFTYNKRHDGSREPVSVTNPEEELYLSTEEPEGLQDPRYTLKNSQRYPQDTEMPAREEFDQRELSEEGFRILEENVRQNAFENSDDSGLKE